MRPSLAVALLTILACLAGGFPAVVAANADAIAVARYVFPANLGLSIFPSGAWSPEQGGTLRARIASRVGTLRRLEIFFETSPDLAVYPTTSRVEQISEGDVKVIPLSIRPGDGRPDAMGSWVRMRVRYLPDFERIAQIVGDPKAYPHAFERQRLLDIVARNAERATPYTAAFRFFAR